MVKLAISSNPNARALVLSQGPDEMAFTKTINSIKVTAIPMVERGGGEENSLEHLCQPTN